MGDPQHLIMTLDRVSYHRYAGENTSAFTGEVPPSVPASTSLKIIHVLRAPLGGLFRHVMDVARGQIERGHRVGLIVDSTTGGARADAILREFAPQLALGVERVPITRQLSTVDFYALHRIARRIKAQAPDVLHGHGAKGAALTRLTLTAPNAIRAYTPHGGSLVYCPGTVSGGFYRSLERILNPRTDLFLFESSYVAELYRKVVAPPLAMVRIVRNGIAETEFEPAVPRADAADIVCVGELRPVKAMDVLIDALAILRKSGRRVTATIAGEGPDAAKLQAQANRLGLADQVRFIGHCPARTAFTMGRMLVIPSRAEFASLCGVGSRRGRAAHYRDRRRRQPGNIWCANRQAHTARRHCGPHRSHHRSARRAGGDASRRADTQIPDPQRILADDDGRVQSRRLPRSHRDAKTCSLCITNF